jgi:hypothetical protein
MEAGFKNAGHAGLVARHSSEEAMACAPMAAERKPTAMSSDLSDAEKL